MATMISQVQPGPIQASPSLLSGNASTFDYVIVGGGTAGLALAARLVESSSYTIAVVEAGGSYEQDTGNLSVVPGFCLAGAGTDPTDFNPLTDWGFVTEPQKKWAHEVGDESFEFENLLPFYKKSTQYTPPKQPFINSTNNQDPKAWSGTGGPLQVSHGNFVDPYGSYVQPAVESLGMRPINGFQSGQLIGSGYTPYTVDPQSAHRSSSETSYLQSVQNKTSLQVYSHSLAEKIIFDKGNRATGVVISSKGSEFTLNARKEVILSAGVFQSPQLLMLSGVGARSKLEALKIPVKVELPGVGENLQDHPLFGSQYRVNMPTVSAALNSPELFAAAQAAYNDHAVGPLTIPTTGLVGWEKLPEPYRSKLASSNRKSLDSSFPADWPELEHIAVNAAVGYQQNYMTADPIDGFNYATMATSMVAPLSRGTVNLASSRASDLPLIDPNFLAHPADAELAIAAIRRQREIWKAMDALTIGDEYLPGPNVTSDEDILKYIKQSVAPTWHASSTCKMGRQGDRMAVVDSEGKVFGTKGLRIVDASVFPFVLPGHPQATVYALAEKIAGIILKMVKQVEVE